MTSKAAKDFAAIVAAAYALWDSVPPTLRQAQKARAIGSTVLRFSDQP